MCKSLFYKYLYNLMHEHYRLEVEQSFYRQVGNNVKLCSKKITSWLLLLQK